METLQIKEVAQDVFYLGLGEVKNCSSCSKQFSFYNQMHPQRSNGWLIFEPGHCHCSLRCERDFLKLIRRFVSIAYVVPFETANRNPWGHVTLVHAHNINTKYFNSFDDALGWAVEQQQH